MRRQILVGALKIAGGSAGDQFLGLVRNIIIARIVGPENFGIGLTFALLVSFLESAADLAWDRFIIQDREGDDPSLLSTIHLFMVARGVLLSIALFLLAHTAAAIFAVPESAVWSYQVLAIVPFFKGLMHLDVKRFQRNLRYDADILTVLSGGAASLLVGATLAWWLKDYHAMLYALIAKFAVGSIVSHVLAERSFRFALAPDIARRAWRYGWPLMVNGLVLFLATQGDRAVISRWLGAESLGNFGAAAMLTLGASGILLDTTRRLGLPLLARHQSNPDEFAANFWLLGAALVPVVFAATTGFFAILPEVLPLVFGRAFAVSGLVVYWLVVASALQLFRQWATTALLALGHSQPIMWSNVLRTLGLGLAVAALVNGGGLAEVAAATAVGEAIATTVSFVFMRSRCRLGGFRFWFYTGTLVGANAACFAIYTTVSPSDHLLWFTAHAVVLIVGGALLVALSPDIRRVFRYLVPAGG